MARAPRQPPRPQARRAQQKAGGRSLAPHPTGQPGQSARSSTTTTPPGVVATHLTQTSLAGPRTVMRPRQGALCRRRGGGRPVPPAPRSSRPQATACVTCCVCPHGQTSKPFAGPRAQQLRRGDGLQGVEDTFAISDTLLDNGHRLRRRHPTRHGVAQTSAVAGGERWLAAEG